MLAKVPSQVWSCRSIKKNSVRNIIVRLFYISVATYGNIVISVVGHRKNTDRTEMFLSFEALC